MRVRWLAAAVPLLLGACASAPPPPVAPVAPSPPSGVCARDAEADRRELMRRHHALLEAMNSGDVDRVMAFLDPRAIITSPDVRVAEPVLVTAWGTEQQRAYVSTHLLAPGRRWQHRTGVLTLACDTAVIGGLVGVSRFGVEHAVPRSLTWVRTDGEWKVLSLQIERLP